MNFIVSRLSSYALQVVKRDILSASCIYRYLNFVASIHFLEGKIARNGHKVLIMAILSQVSRLTLKIFPFVANELMILDRLFK